MTLKKRQSSQTAQKGAQKLGQTPIYVVVTEFEAHLAG
jgi:hypothetical protein